MDRKRVQEIVESLGVIEVYYNGEPVWIEGINEEIAELTIINTNKKIEVKISNLTESKI